MFGNKLLRMMVHGRRLVKQASLLGRDMVLLLLFVLVIATSIYGIGCFFRDDRLEERSFLLVQSAYHADEGAVRALLALGVDPNRLDTYGNSALDVALFRGAEGVASLLRQAGAREDLLYWKSRMRNYEWESQ